MLGLKNIKRLTLLFIIVKKIFETFCNTAADYPAKEAG